MKNKAFKMLLCFLSAVLIFCTAVTSVIAEDKSVDEVQNIINGIIEYKFEENDCDNIQSLIDNAFCESAGDAEWYIIALSQYGEYDYSKYEAALIKYLDENDIKSASTRLKYSLALIAIDSNSEYIDAFTQQGFQQVEPSEGQQAAVGFLHGLGEATHRDGCADDLFLLADQILDLFLVGHLGDEPTGNQLFVNLHRSYLQIVI